MEEANDIANALPPFDDSRDLSQVKICRVLRFENSGRSAVVLGQLDGKELLLSLDQKAACNDEKSLLSLISSGQLEVTMTNYSGAEYSYYTSKLYNVEVIWPAKRHQIHRKMPAEWHLFEESADMYENVSCAFVDGRSKKEGWIDAVVSLSREKERNLFVSDAFIINVDTKWKSHGELTTNPTARQTWHGASWTNDLYILAISRNEKLKSIRDLDGSFVSLLRDMKSALTKCALDVYGVPKHKIKIFFHYHPQFYRLHAHCTRIEYVNPGCETERAHLIDAVIANLELDTKYYRNATLPAKFRVGEMLYNLLIDYEQKNQNDHHVLK